MRLAVASAAAPEEPARALAARLELPYVTPDTAAGDGLLLWTGERLELHDLRPGAPGPIYVDFVSGRAAHRRLHGGGRDQALARAVGMRRGGAPSVVDATAGMGRDGFVLASLGCSVTLVERSSAVAALLADGLARAHRDPATAPVAARMTLHTGDAASFLAGLGESEAPEVVYLDPMYPHRGKTALPKKEMRLFRELVGEDLDAAALLDAARRRALERVVVKRPRAGETLAGPAPSLAVRSKNTRFDVYLLR